MKNIEGLSPTSAIYVGVTGRYFDPDWEMLAACMSYLASRKNWSTL